MVAALSPLTEYHNRRKKFMKQKTGGTRLSSSQYNCLLPQKTRLSSPYLGFFRHSPPEWKQNNDDCRGGSVVGTCHAITVSQLERSGTIGRRSDPASSSYEGLDLMLPNHCSIGLSSGMTSSSRRVYFPNDDDSNLHVPCCTTGGITSSSHNSEYDGSLEANEDILAVSGYLPGGNTTLISWLEWVLQEPSSGETSRSTCSDTCPAINILDRLAGMLLQQQEDFDKDRRQQHYSQGNYAISEEEGSSRHYHRNSAAIDMFSSIANHMTVPRTILKRLLLGKEAEEVDDITSLLITNGENEIDEEMYERMNQNLMEFFEDEPLSYVRLDYVVHQMDVYKMAKTASRHLDCNSVLSLPTMICHYTSEGMTVIPDTNNSSDDPYKEEPKQKGESSNDKETTTESWEYVDDETSKDNKNNKLRTKREDNECVICLEMFRDGERLRALPCGHLFHVGCIDHWLMGTYSDDECFTTGCPTCKKAAVSSDVENLNNCGANNASSFGGEGGETSVPSWAFFRLGNILSRGS